MVSSTPDKQEVRVEQFEVSKIKQRFRLRSPKEERIKELANSIETLGLVNPITIDHENYLIAGFHRLHTHVSYLGMKPYL